MNPRIKELADQCWVSYSYEHPISSEKYKTVESSEFNKEKFAELIVRECFRIVDDYGVERARDPEKYLGESLKVSINITNAAWKIREHFGVEE